MKKIKKLWNENRILFVLFMILIVCFIAICCVFLSYFVGAKKSVYGDRLKGKVKIVEKDKKEYIKALEDDEMIDSVSYRAGVRTIYITITFNEKASLEEAKSKAVASLEKLKKRVVKYYDINFILIQEKSEKDESKGFTVMGSSNVNGNGVVWSNNTKIVEDEK